MCAELGEFQKVRKAMIPNQSWVELVISDMAGPYGPGH